MPAEGGLTCLRRRIELADHEAGAQFGGEERRLRRHQQALAGGALDLGDADRADQHGGERRHPCRRRRAPRRGRAGRSRSRARRRGRVPTTPHRAAARRRTPQVSASAGRRHPPGPIKTRNPSRSIAASVAGVGGSIGSTSKHRASAAFRSSGSTPEYRRWIASTLSCSATSSLTNARVSSDGSITDLVAVDPAPRRNDGGRRR